MDKIKLQNEKPDRVEDVVFDTQSWVNNSFINDLQQLIKTNSTIPTHIPKKFVDCFWLYWDGSTTHELYVYINNSWKKTSLT